MRTCIAKVGRAQDLNPQAVGLITDLDGLAFLCLFQVVMLPVTLKD